MEISEFKVKGHEILFFEKIKLFTIFDEGVSFHIKNFTYMI